MMSTVIKGVTLVLPMSSTNEVAGRNMETIIEFFSLYLKDKARFYSLWTDKDPQVVTPFVTNNVVNCVSVTRTGWTAIKTFWDPIFDEMRGRFDWYIDEFICGENPNIVVTRTHSIIDVQTGATWGNKRVAYNGRYLQIFRFDDGKLKEFEEYYDTAFLNSQYGS